MTISNKPRGDFAQLSEILIPGNGICVDIGCGAAPHANTISQAGYRWVGLDMRSNYQITVRGNALSLPFCNSCCHAVLTWQSLEHFPNPWLAVAEMHRVLVPGGIIFGSTSFLEPFHDSSYFGFSELGLTQLLNENGFRCIQVIPGITCFPLIAWTLAQRMGSGKLSSLAFRSTRGAMNLFTRFYPTIRELALRSVGAELGHVEESYWFRRVPYEFAGHLIFRAEKSF